ncbi:peroxisomal biogenesis factor 3 [Athalia rosae]|uniref:peroxisomal biogenesis factor 3 n=1 Tax=Athalia rosae TaxID=37344 RepID=UPI00062506E4|nr:peroxisomal biogenesis factor 3 [Athalia rosae]
MFSRMRDFLYRHRRKFVVSGVLVGGVIFATRYTQRKLREWQESETRAFIERTRRQQHFESTERTCNQTILSLANGLRDTITSTLDTEAIVEKLRLGSGDKISLWNELKVLALARSAALIYASTILVVTLRIQLNVMGGYMFRDSKNPGQQVEIDGPMQEKYLSICEYFMSEGAVKLSQFIKGKVEETAASITLAQKLSLRDVEQIYLGITSSISADSNKDPIKNLSSYVLLPNCEAVSDKTLSKIIAETLDLMESEEIQSLVRSSIRTGFVMMVDHVSEYFFDSSFPGVMEQPTPVPGPSSQSNSTWTNATEKPLQVAQTNGFLNVNKMSMPMAKLIPIVNGQVPAVPRTGDSPSVWVKQLILNDQLKSFGANVYEAFSF